MARNPKGFRFAASAMDSRAKASFSGPFFSPNADNTLRQNIRGMLQAVADEGESAVQQRSPRFTGAFVAGVEGRVRSVSGKRWALTAVISQTHAYAWKNKGARGFSGRAEAQYRGGKVEARYRMFRAVTSQLRAARAVLAADIAKGLE